MNFSYEQSSQEPTFLDSLIAANAQAVEVREQVPYQPVVYAIPEEWLTAEMELLKNASNFQPELYRLIGQRMTRQEFRQMQDQQLQTIRTELQDQMRSIRSTLQQDGSVREQNFSRTSELLCDSRKDMGQLVERLESRLKRILIFTAVGSMALSVLACMVLQHWLG